MQCCKKSGSIRQEEPRVVLRDTQKTHPCELGLGHPWPQTVPQDDSRSFLANSGDFLDIALLTNRNDESMHVTSRFGVLKDFVGPSAAGTRQPSPHGWVHGVSNKVFQQLGSTASHMPVIPLSINNFSLYRNGQLFYPMLLQTCPQEYQFLR